MEERRELDVSRKTPSQVQSSEAFEIEEKHRKGGLAGRKGKESGLEEVWKMENEEKSCRRWEGVYCIQEAHAD